MIYLIYFQTQTTIYGKNIYSVLSQTLDGLDFLHKNNIIYNDLKMENIMISGLKFRKQAKQLLI